MNKNRREDKMKKTISLMILTGLLTLSSAYAADKVVAPDNSARNKKIVDANGLTAQDQSNLQKDVDVTTRIRKQLVDDSTLSMNAKNVKVIVLKNGVTLKGPVETRAERERVLNIATTVAPNHNIYNQMSVLK
jgi:hyperosmotically inducible periplasmic protein